MHLLQIIIISFTEAVHQISIKIEVVIFWDLCMHGHYIAFFCGSHCEQRNSCLQNCQFFFNL